MVGLILLSSIDFYFVSLPIMLTSVNSREVKTAIGIGGVGFFLHVRIVDMTGIKSLLYPFVVLLRDRLTTQLDRMIERCEGDKHCRFAPRWIVLFRDGTRSLTCDRCLQDALYFSDTHKNIRRISHI
jgi:hypothetical protein